VISLNLNKLDVAPDGAWEFIRRGLQICRAYGANFQAVPSASTEPKPSGYLSFFIGRSRWFGVDKLLRGDVRLGIKLARMPFSSGMGAWKILERAELISPPSPSP